MSGAACSFALALVVSSTVSTPVLWVDAGSPPEFARWLEGQVSDADWRVSTNEPPEDVDGVRCRLREEEAGLELRLDDRAGRQWHRALAGLRLDSSGMEAAALAVRFGLEDRGSWPRAAPGSRIAGGVSAFGGPSGLGVSGGVGLLLAIGQGAWAGVLGLGGWLPQEVDDAVAVSTLGRWEVSLGPRLRLFESASLAADLTLAGGAVWWRRSTSARLDIVEATPDADTLGGLVRLEGELAWSVGEGLSLGLVLGLDALPGRPRLVYAGDGAPTPTEPWPLQPWLGIRGWAGSLFSPSP